MMANWEQRMASLCVLMRLRPMVIGRCAARGRLDLRHHGAGLPEVGDGFVLVVGLMTPATLRRRGRDLVFEGGQGASPRFGWMGGGGRDVNVSPAVLPPHSPPLWERAERSEDGEERRSFDLTIQKSCPLSHPGSLPKGRSQGSAPVR